MWAGGGGRAGGGQTEGRWGEVRWIHPCPIPLIIFVGGNFGQIAWEIGRNGQARGHPATEFALETFAFLTNLRS